MRFSDMSDEELAFLSLQFAEGSKTLISSGTYCLRQIQLYTALQSEVEWEIRRRKSDV